MKRKPSYLFIVNRRHFVITWSTAILSHIRWTVDRLFSCWFFRIFRHLFVFEKRRNVKGGLDRSLIRFFKIESQYVVTDWWLSADQWVLPSLDVFTWFYFRFYQKWHHTLIRFWLKKKRFTVDHITFPMTFYDQLPKTWDLINDS